MPYISNPQKAEGGEKMNKKIDEQLLRINNLHWLPWIGKNYSASQTKLMVLGESHYLCAGDSPDEYGIDFTRSFIGMHQNGEEGTNVIRNFEKTLLNRDYDEELSKKEMTAISDSFVYQVIIQRLLSASEERPDDSDFQAGWHIILETMKILKPNTVVSLGVKAFDVLTNLEYEGLTIKKEKWGDDKINNAYPRYCRIELDGHPIDIIFLRHTSGTRSGYYPLEWHKFLKKYFDVSRYLSELKL